MNNQSPLTRLAMLLGQAHTVSEGHSGRAFDLPQAPNQDTLGPPGTFARETSLYDDMEAMLHRFADAMEVELNRYRGRWPAQGRLDPHHREERIRTHYPDMSADFIAYVEGVEKAYVERVRRGLKAA